MIPRAFVQICLYVTWIYCTPSLCYTIDEVHRLKEDLFKTSTYDTSVRPVLNQSQVIQVNVAMTLTGIYDIDVNNGHMTTSGYLTISWTDEQLRWNSTKYGGLDMISVSPGKIWHPVISQLYGMNLELPVSRMLIFSSGMVVWVAAADIIAECDLNMKLYPFDKHTCNLGLLSLMAKTELQLASTLDHIDIDNYHSNGKWRLSGTQAYIREFVDRISGGSFDIYHGTIEIQRIPDFILLHTSIPLTLLLYLSIFVHFVPLQGGERVSFSVTLFLTLVYFSTSIADTLPHTSTRVSLMSMHILTSLFISGLGVVSSIILCKLAEESDKSIQPWLRKVALLVIRSKRGHIQNTEGDKSRLHAADTTEVGQQNEIGAYKRHVATNVVSPDDEVIDPDMDKEACSITWRIVADSLDYVIFRVSITLCLIFSFIAGTIFLVGM